MHLLRSLLCLVPLALAHGPAAVSALSGLQNVVDVAVIGSGPAGCGAAVYAARGGASKTVLFAGPMLGGQLTQTGDVENFPGQVRALGATIMQNFRKQAIDKGVPVVDAAIADLDVTRWPYRLKLENGTTINALTVIIATGSLPKQLGVPGEQAYARRGVSACAICDGWLYQGKDVVVIGGGDTALTEALHLAPLAKKVTVLVRTNHLRACDEKQRQLATMENCTIVYNRVVKEIIGNADGVTGVRLVDAQGHESLVPTDAVFLGIGRLPCSQLCVGKITLDANGYITVDKHTQETSVAGIFAAGDVAESDTEKHQAGNAATSGGDAGRSAVRFLNERGLLVASARKNVAWYQPSVEQLVRD